MADPSNLEYYERREKSERALAARAADPRIARIHTELADRYAEYVQSQARPMMQLVR